MAERRARYSDERLGMYEVPGFSAGMVMARLGRIRRMLAAITLEAEAMERETQRWQRRCQEQAGYPKELRG